MWAEIRALNILVLLQPFAISALSSLDAFKSVDEEVMQTPFWGRTWGNPSQGLSDASSTQPACCSPMARNSAPMLGFCGGGLLKQRAEEDHGLLPTFPHHCWNSAGMGIALP